MNFGLEVVLGAAAAAIASGTIAVRRAQAAAKTLRGESDREGELAPVTIRIND
jgi:hypothetical protein